MPFGVLPQNKAVSSRPEQAVIDEECHAEQEFSAPFVQPVKKQPKKVGLTPDQILLLADVWVVIRRHGNSQQKRKYRELMEELI